MGRKLFAILAALVMVTVTALGWALPTAHPPIRRSARSGPSASEVRDRDIAFYQARAARDPYGARDRAALGVLYLARGRATGDGSDYVRAESLATVSLHTRHKRNGAAAQVLVGALMAEHRFADAWQVMLPEVQADSTDLVSRATLGEIALELGHYAEADKLFGQLTIVRTNTSIAPRYARWLELNGRSGEARALLIATRAQFENGFRVPPEQLAWFDLRIGELAFRNGRNDLAQTAFDRGLAIVPTDQRLLAAKARLAAAREDWRDAIALGESAMAVSFEPTTLGLLSEAYEATGDSAKASEYARAMEVSLSNQPGSYHRGWALFLLDHDRQVDRVMEKAGTELATRKDVYGYDVMGWALHKAGRDTEAKAMADSALARHTRDAMLCYHHGLISLSLKDSTQARSDLKQAIEISPDYRPGYGPSARAVLAGLGN